MWYLLATSLTALSFNRYLAYCILSLTSFIGWGVNMLEFPALIVIAAIVVCGVLVEFKHKHPPKTRYWLEGLYLFIALSLVLHLLPGFNNTKVLDAITIEPLSIPFSMHFNFDKALVPFVLLTGMSTLFVSKPLFKAGATRWGLLVLSVPALLTIAVALGVLKVEPHAPQWFAQFALANVFFVSLAEEALFRGYLQQRLSQICHPLAALLIASLVFGLMHDAGGHC
ncbi:type II CAAX prenyl endopeptidase Rce1 family protein [Enterobacter cloacae complex sp. I2]|uniref:CPBP family intramembrane glutamic endopeptidase n=1 Tax=Enterobacter cloacae complex sp. I2 TaxID=2779603 RepID=UPI00351CB130